MELVLHVTRDVHSRLSGSVRASKESSPREFSGVLELLRLFEELVPVERTQSVLGGRERSEAEEETWTEERF